MSNLREKWPWNSEFLQLFKIAPSLIGVVATALTYPSYGVHSFWFLSGILVALVLWLVFSTVGNKVALLRQKHIGDSGEVAEALLVIGAIQSPGLAILRARELVLAPIVGDACTIPLSDIEVLREGRWLPGKYVWGKRAFIVKTSLQMRLAFAVAESIGARWSPYFASA
jgi:hypothetical protein